VTLPSMPTPNEKPRQQSRVVLLAWVVNELAGQEVVAIPRRDVQLALNRVGGSAVSRNLAGLVEDGWLRSFEDSGPTSYRYEIGTRFTRSPALWQDWSQMSQALWGPNGLMNTYPDPTILGQGMLRINGTLCLSAVVRAGSTVSAGQVSVCLAFLMARQTVIRQLRGLTEVGLLEASDGGFEATTDWRQVLDELVVNATGGATRRTKLKGQIAKERAAYGDAITIGRFTKKDRQRLLRSPCIDCGGPSNEVEHFPPRKHRGLSHIHSTFPICRRCNNSLSPFIRSLPKGPLPKVAEFKLVDGIDPGDILRESILHHREQFIQASRRWKTATTRHEARSAKVAAMRAIQFAHALLHHLKTTRSLSRNRLPGTIRRTGPREGRRDGRIPY
jgi:hypothetical protein